MKNLFRIVAAALLLGLSLLTPASASHTPLDAASGRLLVASESMNDPRFAESVILLLQHGPAGSIGLILNNRSNLLPDELPDEIISKMQHIYFGGPVEPLAASVLVFGKVPLDQSRKVLKGVQLADLEKIVELLGQKNKVSFRIFLGYSSWAPGQLEMELAHGAWQVYPADERLLSQEDDMEYLWKELLESGPVISL